MYSYIWDSLYDLIYKWNKTINFKKTKWFKKSLKLCFLNYSDNQKTMEEKDDSTATLKRFDVVTKKYFLVTQQSTI